MLGMVLGLFAASSQSASYLFSRMYVTAPRRSNRQLLVIAHAVQGLFCLPLMLLLWPQNMPTASVWVPSLLAMTMCYLLAQAALFFALTYVDASRVSPLLGLKIVMLAAAAVIVLGQTLTGWQWAAVFLCTFAAIMLNYTGGKLPLPAVIGILAACLGYCGSDIGIRIFIDRLHPALSPIFASFMGVLISYVFCGALALPLLIRFGSRRKSDWLASLPYAGSWLLAMMFLFACFATAGVVLGNILQSTRGLVSILLGVIVARAGHVHLEKKVTRQVLVRRAVAAALMVTAIAMYVMG